MIIYRCDRCGQETTPDKLYEAELLVTPRTLDGGEDTDKEDRTWLGQICFRCVDVTEPLVEALFKPPPSTNAVDPSAADPGTLTPRDKNSSSPF